MHTDAPSKHLYHIRIDGYPVCVIESENKLMAKEIARPIAGLFCIKSILCLDYFILIDLTTDSIVNVNRKLSSGVYKLIYN